MGEREVVGETLVLDVAGKLATVGLFDGDELLRFERSTSPFSSEELVPLIHLVTKGNFSQLTAIAFTTGPGSYTGLRSGVATAMGLASALGLNIYGVPTLFGRSFSRASVEQDFVAVLHAAGDEYYGTIYRRLDQRALNYLEVRALPPMEIRAINSELNLRHQGRDSSADLGLESPQLLMCGDGDIELSEALEGIFKAARYSTLKDAKGIDLIKIVGPNVPVEPTYGRGINAKTIQERSGQRLVD